MIACVSTHNLGGSVGMLPPGKFCKLDALKSLLRPFLTKLSLEIFHSRSL